MLIDYCWLYERAQLHLHAESWSLHLDAVKMKRLSSSAVHVLVAAMQRLFLFASVNCLLLVLCSRNQQHGRRPVDMQHTGTLGHPDEQSTPVGMLVQWLLYKV